MGTLASLDYTDNFAAAKKPFLTDLRTALDSIETYINTTLKNNFNQLSQDVFPSGYAYDSDGNKQFGASIDLFQKQNAIASYTGGNITLSTTGAWTDVDASNAKITFTPSYIAGDFLARFQFTIDALSSNATNEVEVRFRLTDGSTTSTAIPAVRIVSGVNASRYDIPVNVSHVFTSLAASAQTIKLQYFLVTLSNTTLLALANSNSPIVGSVEKV